MNTRIITMFAILSLVSCGTFAVPPVGYTLYPVNVDSNGVLIGVGTNLVAANSMATSQQVASAIATGMAAQASALSITLATVMARDNQTGTNELILTPRSKSASIHTTGSNDDTDTDTNSLTITSFGFGSQSRSRGACLKLRGNEYSSTSGGGLSLYAGSTTGQYSGTIEFSTEGGYVEMQKTGLWDFKGLPISNVVYHGNGEAITVGSRLTNTNLVQITGSGNSLVDGLYTWNGSVWDRGGQEIAYIDGAFRVREDNSGIYHYCITSSAPIGAWSVDNSGVEPAPTSTWGATPYTAKDAFDQLAAALGAIWHTNQVLALDGTTNTLIYLGAP